MRFRQRAAEHSEVLAEDVDQTAVDGAVTGHDAVAQKLLLGKAEAGGAVRNETVHLDEAVVVEQQLDPLARRKLAARMLRLDPLLTTTQLGLGFELFQQLEFFLHAHGR